MTTPMRTTFLPVAAPDVGEDEVAAVSEVLRSGWLTTGPKAKEFEEAFAEAVGASHAIAVNSCTAALHLSLAALGVKPGDKVVTTPYTFAATAEVIRYFDARPVFVDVCPDTLNMDPAALEQAIAGAKAVIPVDYAGLPCDLDTIIDLSHRAGAAVVEDAAHAFPARYREREIGAIADFTCFSFYATKTITTGEGGMLCTERADWADNCRMNSLHGISRNAWKRYTSEGSWYYEILAPGYKYNLTDMAAAMGLVQLRKARAMRARRREIAQRYSEAFGDVAALQVPTDDSTHEHAWHIYTLRLNLECLEIGRDEFISQLKERNIGTSVHFIPLHLHPYYRETYGYRPQDFPVAHREYLRQISLPLFSKMTDADVDDVIAAVQEISWKNRPS